MNKQPVNTGNVVYLVFFILATLGFFLFFPLFLLGALGAAASYPFTGDHKAAKARKAALKAAVLAYAQGE